MYKQPCSDTGNKKEQFTFRVKIIYLKRQQTTLKRQEQQSRIVNQQKNYESSTMYNPELIDIANFVYSLAMERTNYLTKSIMQCELGTLIKGYLIG